MHDVYRVESNFESTDWKQIQAVVEDLLAAMQVVSVKRFVNGKYISTFYFTHAN